MKIFNDTPKDALLIVVTAIAVVYPFLFAFQFDSLSWLGLVLWSIGLPITAMWHFNTTMHYHIHRKIFANKKANEILEALSSIPMLIGYEEYKAVHLTHHKWVNDPIINGKVNDPTSTFRNGKNGEEESILSYMFLGCLRYLNNINGFDLNQPVVFKNLQKIKQEQNIKLIVLLMLITIQWQFIPLYLLLIYFSRSFNSAITYKEHHNVVDWNDNKKDSCSYYGKIYNLLTFNSGYHQEHHYRPGARWDDLPRIKHQLHLIKTK
jgi:fatty acid desaturase